MKTKIYILIIILIFIPNLVLSASFEEAYEDISDAPAFLARTSCYKYYMIIGDIHSAVRNLKKYEHEARDHLSKKGYSNRDIEVAIFAKNKYLEAQYEQMFFSCSLNEDGCRLDIVKNNCVGQFP